MVKFFLYSLKSFPCYGDPVHSNQTPSNSILIVCLSCPDNRQGVNIFKPDMIHIYHDKATGV
jgi:hypothetical protein